MNVIWSETVLGELAQIHEHLAETTSSEVALKVIDRILARATHIAAFPESGRVVEDFASPSIREVVERPYRIVYEIQRDEDRIEVLAVFHSARRPPWLRDQ